MRCIPGLGTVYASLPLEQLSQVTGRTETNRLQGNYDEAHSATTGQVRLALDDFLQARIGPESSELFLAIYPRQIREAVVLCQTQIF